MSAWSSFEPVSRLFQRCTNRNLCFLLTDSEPVSQLYDFRFKCQRKIDEFCSQTITATCVSFFKNNDNGLCFIIQTAPIVNCFWNHLNYIDELAMNCVFSLSLFLVSFLYFSFILIMFLISVHDISGCFKCFRC